MNNARKKFQDLLLELFQFDCADLDFGIYRIMNHKRDVIEKFISADLPRAIADELSRGGLAEQSLAAQELESVRQQVRESLGAYVINGAGKLDEAYHATPLGKRYLTLTAKAAGGRGREALETTIFNHLYSFFSRYYQDGDFISKRRYSKRQRYAIPYNGEEVHLHWANHDQYYVKTAEYFQDYSFASRGVTIHFKLKTANVEQNNVKGEARFFIPRPKEIVWDAKARQLVIPFEFRPLTEQETVTYGTKNQQDKINAEAAVAILKRLSPKDHPDAVAVLTAERRKTSDGTPVSWLEHHLRQYTQRNTSDFFIHKDLKGFLSGELDFYLKNEVLNLGEMETAGEDRSEGWFQVMRVIKAVGGRIIEFLDQIESFQKMLWEKRKFITETQYCITVGTIDERFYPEIATCDAQWAEWKDLFHIDEEKTDLFTSGKNKKDRRVAFLKAHPTLVLDTKHMEHNLADSLIGSIDNIFELTDGVLFHSENFHALTLLHAQYCGLVDCVYIDPPYNAQSSEIIYKNSYKHSTWLAMIENRIQVVRPLYAPTFVHVTAIDEVENFRLGLLLNKLYPDCEDACISIVHNPTGQQGNNFSYTHEFAHFVFPQNCNCIGLEDRDGDTREAIPDVRPLRNVSSGRNHLRASAANCFYPIYIKDGNIIGFGDVCDDSFHPKGINVIRDDGIIEIYPIDTNGVESKWVFARQTVQSVRNELAAKYDQKSGTWDITRTKIKFRYKSLWSDKRYSANSWGSVVLNSILPGNPFSYPKSIYTVCDCLDAALKNRNTGIILDYFAGSGTTGHAVVNLNRDTGGHRKFILVEMANHFDSVLIPRIKKVIFTPEWKDGKPKRMATQEEAARSPRIVKYMRLESYEDALNNIAFDDATAQATLKFEDYLLRYMLRWETRKSETLLNVEKLAHPFTYKLTLTKDGESVDRAVDVPETFNYLLGLHVATRKVYNDDGRRYLVYRGFIDHRQIAVIWRETYGWQKKDLERDKKFVASQKLTEGADEVFVNGDSFIPNARALEPVFKARMFSTVEA